MARMVFQRERIMRMSERQKAAHEADVDYKNEKRLVEAEPDRRGTEELGVPTAHDVEG